MPASRASRPPRTAPKVQPPVFPASNWPKSPAMAWRWPAHRANHDRTARKTPMSRHVEHPLLLLLRGVCSSSRRSAPAAIGQNNADRPPTRPTRPRGHHLPDPPRSSSDVPMPFRRPRPNARLHRFRNSAVSAISAAAPSAAPGAQTFRHRLQINSVLPDPVTPFSNVVEYSPRHRRDQAIRRATDLQRRPAGGQGRKGQIARRLFPTPPSSQPLMTESATRSSANRQSHRRA